VGGREGLKKKKRLPLTVLSRTIIQRGGAGKRGGGTGVQERGKKGGGGKVEVAIISSLALKREREKGGRKGRERNEKRREKGSMERRNEDGHLRFLRHLHDSEERGRKRKEKERGGRAMEKKKRKKKKGGESRSCCISLFPMTILFYCYN